MERGNRRQGGKQEEERGRRKLREDEEDTRHEIQENMKMSKRKEGRKECRRRGIGRKWIKSKILTVTKET